MIGVLTLVKLVTDLIPLKCAVESQNSDTFSRKALLKIPSGLSTAVFIFCANSGSVLWSQFAIDITIWSYFC